MDETKLQALADRWSREAAAIHVPDLIPGKPDVRTAVAVADVQRLDQCAEELRDALAGGDLTSG